MVKAAYLLLAAGTACIWLAMAWLVPGQWLVVGAGLIATAGAVMVIKAGLDTRSNRVLRCSIGEGGAPDALGLHERKHNPLG